MLQPEISRRLGFVLILLFWGWAGLHNYPAPFLDDGYFIGAAINLAQHGVFSNPQCESLITIGSADRFFAYMPLHSYVLAAWLKLAGISSLSFRVLYTALALGASLLLFRLFPAIRHSWVVAIFVCVAIFGFLGGTGLRPDALGLVFFLAGIDVFRVTGPVQFFIRNLCLGLAVITWPNVAVLALVLSASGLLYRKIVLDASYGQLIRWLMAIAVAYGLCFLLFLACIDGRLGEFLHTMARAQQMGAEGVRNRFHLFTPLGVAKWIIIQTAVLAVALVCWMAWRSDPERKAVRFIMGLFVIVFLVLGLSSINSATAAHLWAFACLMGTLGLIVERGGKWLPLGGFAVLLLIAAFGHAHVAIEACLADPPPTMAQRQALLGKIEAMRPRRLNVDAVALRYLYDYNLPANAYDFEWSSTTGWGAPTDAATLPPDSVSVVAVKNAFPTPRSPDAGKGAQVLRVMGVPLGGTFENLYEMEIIDNRR